MNKHSQNKLKRDIGKYLRAEILLRFGKRREHIFAERRRLCVESYCNMSWILLSNRLQKHRHKPARPCRVLPGSSDQVIPDGKPRPEHNRVPVD